MKEVNPALLAVLVDGLDPNATLTGAAVAVDPEKAQAENAAEEARKHFSIHSWVPTLRLPVGPALARRIVLWVSPSRK